MLALIGCLLGFFLILVSAQSVINFKFIFSDSKQGIGAQYMVLNKKIGLLSSMANVNTSFSLRELDEISQHPSIQHFSPFIGNAFQAEAYLELKDQGQAISLKTDLFLESVKDDFIDIELDKWNWKESDSEIPIILPSDFINLYNFTYAPARGLPQISKSTAKFFGFNIHVRGRNDQATYKANIVGFSNRITSLVVPMSFIEYANSRYGGEFTENKNSIYRIIAEVKPERLAEFHNFLIENNYETNEELLRNAKLVSLLYLILSIVFIVGSIITFNAFTGFILYYNLLIYRSKDDIDSLLRLGYSHHKLVRSYLFNMFFLVLIVFISALLGLIWSQNLFSELLSKYNFEIPASIHTYPVIIMSVFVVVLTGIFYIQIRREIFKIALPV